MPAFLEDHAALFIWITIASVVMFIGTLIAVPVVIIRLPADYFVERKRHLLSNGERSAWRLPLLIARNALGIIFLLAGIAMLVLPGQGVLSILLGVLMMDFPGKYRVERWLVRRPRVLKALNWIRHKAHKQPLAAPSE